jgi:hypothetical protein
MGLARRKAAQARRDGGTSELNPDDALVLLTAEHNEIEKLVRDYEQLPGTADRVEKGKLALRICHGLANHHAVKQQVFYPAAEAVLEGEARVRIATLRTEHGRLIDLIAEIEDTPADYHEFDARVAALAELARRLMKQEEEDIFPELRHSGLDLVGTGERMAARKSQLATQPADREVIRQARKVMGGRR